MSDDQGADDNFNDAAGSAEELNPSAACSALVGRMKTLQLASIDGQGFPHCSYAPFLHDAQNFYIFISELAAHTRYLLDSGKAAAMIVADETDSAQIFARTRVYYQCDVSAVPREEAGKSNPDYERILNAYELRQGKTVALLRGLADFHLVRLSPRTGQFVMGFGQAFRLSGPNLAEYTHIRSA